MSHFPKACLFDVDRTLSDSKGEIRPVTRAALKKLAAAGYEIAVCTGRSYAELKQAILPLFPDDSIHITSGGAQVVRMSGEVVWEKVLPSELVHTIAEKVHALGADFGFSQRTLYAGTPNVLEYKRTQRWPVETIDVYELEDWTTPLLTIGSLNESVHAYMESLEDVEVKSMTNSLGMPYYDVTPIGITKREGAQAWAKAVGVDLAETAAFGDSENDLEVLEYVGTGVAMGNAIPELKAIADFTIEDTDDDGIAQFVDHLLAQNT
ncbi:HAD family hydrolase [Candidatus Woesebacteria bacterium]|nr:HAD family hydrolase [Candidatus Woesebacteria bacterium]